MSALSEKAEATLKEISEGKTSCHRHNRQILDKLRQNGHIKIFVDRKSGTPVRFCRITPEGLRYLAYGKPSAENCFNSMLTAQTKTDLGFVRIAAKKCAR